MASTRGLQRDFKPFAEAILRAARAQDPAFRLTSARRTFMEQLRLYTDWLAGKLGIYTPARPGTSQHERGWAIDIARPQVEPTEDPVLAQLGQEWRQMGGVWGGEKDPVHFEAPKAWTGRA